MFMANWEPWNLSPGSASLIWTEVAGGVVAQCAVSSSAASPVAAFPGSPEAGSAEEVTDPLWACFQNTQS